MAGGSTRGQARPTASSSAKGAAGPCGLGVCIGQSGVANRQFAQRAAPIDEESAPRRQHSSNSWQGEHTDLWMPTVECAHAEGKREVEWRICGSQRERLSGYRTKGQLPEADLRPGAGDGLAYGG